MGTNQMQYTYTYLVKTFRTYSSRDVNRADGFCSPDICASLKPRAFNFVLNSTSASAIGIRKKKYYFFLLLLLSGQLYSFIHSMFIFSFVAAFVVFCFHHTVHRISAKCICIIIWIAYTVLRLLTAASVYLFFTLPSIWFLVLYLNDVFLFQFWTLVFTIVILNYILQYVCSIDHTLSLAWIVIYI